MDDFIAKLWDVHLAVKQEGYVQVFKLRSQDVVSNLC